MKAGKLSVMMTQAIVVEEPATFSAHDALIRDINNKGITQTARNWIIPSNNTKKYIERMSASSFILNLIRNIISLILWPIIRSSWAAADSFPGNLFTHHDDLSNLHDIDDSYEPNMYINLLPDLTPLTIYKDFIRDTTMHISHSSAPNVLHIVDDYTDFSDLVVAKINGDSIENSNMYVGVDTTDFACTLFPKFETFNTEHHQVAEEILKPNVEIDTNIAKLHVLPPAAGLKTLQAAEDSTDEISSLENVINVINNNKRARRRIQKLRKRGKVNHFEKNRNAKCRQELAQFIQDDLDDIFWSKDAKYPTEQEINHPAATVIEADTFHMMTEQIRPGCIFSHFFHFGEKTACENRQWPIIKSAYHQRSKITHVDPKCSIYTNQFERDIVTRQRQWSECSDDFICFETESIQSDFSDDESDNDEKYDDTGSDLDSDDEHFSTDTNPPESGFEEKKVFHHSHQFLQYIITIVNDLCKILIQ